MDKFTHSLTQLQETVVRRDTQSSVARKTPSKPRGSMSAKCLCGWPQNMMLPVGTPDGMEFVGFAMLTDDQLKKASSKIS